MDLFGVFLYMNNKFIFSQPPSRQGYTLRSLLHQLTSILYLSCFKNHHHSLIPRFTVIPATPGRPPLIVFKTWQITQILVLITDAHSMLTRLNQCSQKTVSQMNPTVFTREGNIIKPKYYLGFLLDDTLSFKPHIHNLVKKLKLGFFFQNKIHLIEGKTAACHSHICIYFRLWRPVLYEFVSSE